MSEQTQTEVHKPKLNYWIIFGVMGLLLIIMAVGSFGSTYKNGGNNPLGAQAASPIDPTDPQTQVLISGLQAFSDPQQILSHPEKIEGLKTTLTALITALSSADNSAYAIITKRDEALVLAKKMLEGLTVIQVNPKDPKVKSLVAQFLKDRDELLKLVQSVTGNAAVMIALANEIATYNDGDHQKIPYTQSTERTSTMTVNGKIFPKAADCSSFMSFLMATAGVFPKYPSLQFITDEFAEKGPSRGFKYVYGSGYGSPSISGAEVMSKVQLQPGDLILSWGHGKHGPVHHIMMYIGGPDGKNVVQSRCTKCGGPQYSDFKVQTIVAVLRPPYK